MSPPEGRFVIYIPEPFPEHAVSTLDSRFIVRQGRAGEAYSEAELVPLLADADAIAINSRDPITARVIEGAPRLRVIAKAGSKPTSNVDLAAAERCGVRVTWTPGANAVSVGAKAQPSEAADAIRVAPPMTRSVPMRSPSGPCTI